MAEAVVRLGLDPSGMVAGAQAATASLRNVGQSATRMAQSATRAAEQGTRAMGQSGARAGQQFGRGMAAGARTGTAQFNSAIDQAASRAQARLSAIRPGPIRMPAVQQPRVPAPAAAPTGPIVPPQRTYIDPSGRTRDQYGRFVSTRQGGGPTAPGAPAPRADGGRDGFSSLWALSAAGGQLRGLTDRARMVADEAVEVGSERQVSRAEMRTVVPEDQHASVRAAAREAALGRGDMVVAIDESDFTAAVFRGVASGLETQRAINLVPVSADLALAGQTTPEEAQIGLTDIGSVFRGRSFREMGDIYARGQDIGTFRSINELFQATTKAASTAKAAGLTFEETVGIATTLSRQGPTFRGATGGQKALMAIREMELGAMEKLGMRTERRADGGLDFAANIRALDAADVSVARINEAFGKRAAPAILALIDDSAHLERTIRDLSGAEGTAAENAREHAGIWRSTLQENQAAIDVFRADMGEGAMRVREAGLVVKGTLARMLADIPGAPGAIGGALEVGGMVGGLLGAGLDTAVGLHAFRQLAHGSFNPLNMFRSESAVDQRRQARLARRSQLAVTRGIDGQARRWRGLFGTVNRGLGTSRRGFTGLFRGILRGGMRLGGMIAAELAAALAGQAVSRTVGGGTAGAAGAAGATGGAAMATGAVAGAVGAATATGATVIGGALAPAAVAVASPIALAKRKAEAEATVREQAAAVGASPADTEAAVEEARAANRVLARFRTAREGGTGLLGSMIQGLGFGKAHLGPATDEALQPVADRLPQSDAKLGPLSDLTARGAAIPMTLAEGVTLGAPALVRTVGDMLATIGLPEAATDPTIDAADPLETPGFSLAPAPEAVPEGAPGGEGPPAAVLGALAGVSDPELRAAITALVASNREMVAVNMRMLEEMRRKRRAADGGRAMKPDEHEWPSDVMDYDSAAEILAGLL